MLKFLQNSDCFNMDEEPWGGSMESGRWFCILTFWVLVVLGGETVLVKQVLYHLSHLPALFMLVIFVIGSQFMPVPAQTVILFVLP
jgi:hypothetical protein